MNEPRATELSVSERGRSEPDATEPGAAASQARAELEDTLAAIVEKLNVAKRVGALKRAAFDSYRADSGPWLVGGIGAVALIGGTITWALVAAVRSARR